MHDSFSTISTLKTGLTAGLWYWHKVKRDLQRSSCSLGLSISIWNNYIYIYLIFISSKLRIAWEIHVCAVSISKNPKKTNFFGDFSRRHFSFPRIHILIMASHPSRRGSNFCRFFGLGRRKNNDILGIYKIPKKVTFLGNFLAYIFHYVSFSRLCFYTVLSGWSPTSGWLSEKTPFFRREKTPHFFGRPKKWRFFAWDNTVLFGSSALIAETDTISLRQQAWT